MSMRGAEASETKIAHGCLEKHATIPRILAFGEVLETSLTSSLFQCTLCHLSHTAHTLLHMANLPKAHGTPANSDAHISSNSKVIEICALALVAI